ncbi:MAG: hypothetical protein K2F95_03500 [Alistipes sp.]|nr:hypothetical protein [Alistipes sp.]
MKRCILYLPLLLLPLSADAQSARVLRSEFITFDKRDDARRGIRDNIEKYIDVRPAMVSMGGGDDARITFEQRFDVPASWNDYNAYLHMENTGGAYSVDINGREALHVDDPFTPADLFISPYLRQGENILTVRYTRRRHAQLQQSIEPVARELFDNSYIFAQRRLGIYDFDICLRPDSLRRFGVLQIDVVADNSFDFEETLQVGFDIYSPAGKLLEYSVNEITIDGHSRDTLRFSPYIYHTNENRWTPERPLLYDVMLYVKRNGILREYIPLRIGFGLTELADGAATRFDRPLTLHRERYNAAKDKQTTQAEIKRLKTKGVNTLCPDYPQPRWFYDLCDELGMYVIDRAAIDSPQGHLDRSVGGTPANDPSLAEEYLTRVKSMYYRSRNHTCIIAFALGGDDSGNGYNMYKAYEWLKSTGDPRPVIYGDADGEWNSDMELQN